MMATSKKGEGDPASSGNEAPVQTPDATKIVTPEAKGTGLVASDRPADSGKGKDDKGPNSGKGGSGSGKGPGKDSGTGKGAGKGKGSGASQGGQGKDSKDGQGKGSKDEQPSQIHQLIHFLQEVWIEFKKVTWPTRDQVFRETCSVLVLVAMLTIMVLAFDWVLAHAFFTPLEDWARLHGGGIGRGYQ
jgi:preprotein translocase SecE subunit